MPGYYYNQIVLQHCRTLSFEMEPEYDPTGTDNVWFKYTIRVRGFVGANNGFPGDGNSALSALTLTGLKQMLETPRRPLEYNIGAVSMISLPTGVDDKLGPHPLPAVVSEPCAGTFMVDCGVVVRLYACPTTCANTTQPIVSLRWTQSESFDGNWFSRLHTSGRLMVKATAMMSADNFRPQTVPTVPVNYKRTSSQYTLSPDGLELGFEFVDQEVDRLPPPALGIGYANAITNASGTYTVHVPKGGAIRMGVVTLKLEGPAGCDRVQLLVRAIRMAYAKLKEDRFAVDNPVLYGNFTEDLFTPVINVTMMCQLSTMAGRNFLASTTPPSVMPSVGDTGYINSGLVPQQAPLTGPQRKRIAALAVAAFVDPCACVNEKGGAVLTAATRLTARADARGADPTSGPDPNSTVNIPVLAAAGSPAFPPASSAYQIPPPIDIGGAGSTTIYSTGTLPPLSTTPYVTDTAPYTYYEIESSTTFDSGLVQLPGTGVGNNPNVSQIVSASGAMMTLSLVWAAQRMGLPPQLPSYLSPDPNIVPLKGAIVCSDVKRSADGSDLMFSVAGYYRYAVLDPAQYAIVPGVAPYLGAIVQQAAQFGVSFWTNNAYWAGEGVTGNGSNPFTGDVALEGQPSFPPGFGPQTDQSVGGPGGDQQTGGGTDGSPAQPVIGP